MIVSKYTCALSALFKYSTIQNYYRYKVLPPVVRVRQYCTSFTPRQVPSVRVAGTCILSPRPLTATTLLIPCLDQDELQLQLQRGQLRKPHALLTGLHSFVMEALTRQATVPSRALGFPTYGRILKNRPYSMLLTELYPVVVEFLFCLTFANSSFNLFTK